MLIVLTQGILFGSYARGNPTEDSDLDVVVVLDSEERSKTFDEFIERGSSENNSNSANRRGMYYDKRFCCCIYLFISQITLKLCKQSYSPLLGWLLM